jgi:hypothetical protein
MKKVAFLNEWEPFPQRIERPFGHAEWCRENPAVPARLADVQDRNLGVVNFIQTTFSQRPRVMIDASSIFRECGRCAQHGGFGRQWSVSRWL